MISFKTLKIAFIIFVASFFIVNWNEVSWVFNYKTAFGFIDQFFTPYPSVSAVSIEEYFYPNRSLENKALLEADTQYTGSENSIDIPQINISAPIVFSTSSEIKNLEQDLDLGVSYYPGSVMPGQIGNIVILGHSAPPLWPKIRYDWVFSDLEDLKIDDQVLINYNNKKYTYIIKSIKIIKKGESIPSYSSENKNVLNLISCWPPGKDAKRIVVQAELKTK